MPSAQRWSCSHCLTCGIVLYSSIHRRVTWPGSAILTVPITSLLEPPNPSHIPPGNISHMIDYRAQAPYQSSRRSDEVFLRLTVDSGWHRAGGGSERRGLQANSLRTVMARAATCTPPIQIESCEMLWHWLYFHMQEPLAVERGNRGRLGTWPKFERYKSIGLEQQARART